jgi:hypothetical protein
MVPRLYWTVTPNITLGREEISQSDILSQVVSNIFWPFFQEVKFPFSNQVSNFFIIIFFRAVAAFSKAGLGHKHVAARSSSGRLIGNIVSP